MTEREQSVASLLPDGQTENLPDRIDNILG
jgi:hypothetical protein